MRRLAAAHAVAIDLALLFTAKTAVGLYVLQSGFSHVSDDDYARVVIAQQFAHHPALDPSGTSWLPFPFWLTGGVMLVFGRALTIAQALAFVLGVLSVAAPYAAMRAIGCGRATAVMALGIVLAVPWSAWVGVATVPEAPTACLIAAAAIASGAPRARLVASLALLAAALSRYEAWPVCGVFAAACAWSAKGEAGGRTNALGAAAIAAAGPIAWILWNVHAHGSAFHFVARVAAYRQSIGAAAIPLREKLATFPVALASASPLVVAGAFFGALALRSDRALLRRWRLPLACAASILAFLVYGDVRDGAPTHHPERAVLPILWILAPFAADALRSLARRTVWGWPRRESWVFGLSVAGALAWSALLPSRLRDAPAMSADESRSAQVERGLELGRSFRTSDPGSGQSWRVAPCAYEHFALIAASAAPERFTILPAVRDAVTPECPRLTRGD